MNELTFPGGWYCEAHPNGAYAVVIRDSHIATSRGRVELCPGGNLLQLRLAADGIRFAGTGHNDGMAWEWNGSEWINHGPTFGNSACIYDATDQLVVVHGNVAPTWAQGWAFVDDNHQLVPGWVAYAAKDGLSAWTKHGPLAIGQGHDTGGVITAFGLHQIATGQATWVRFNQAGDQIALAWIQEDRNEARCLWLTVAELLALPSVGTPAPTPTPVPVPVPQPTPEPTPVPTIRTVPMPPRIREIVQELYARNVHLAEGTDDERRQLQTLICEQARYELGPQYGAKKADSGRPRSKDAIAFLDGDVLYAADCFNGSTRKPSVPGEFTEIPGQVFDPVQAIDHLGHVTVPTTGTPVPSSPSSPGAAIDAALVALKAECEGLRARLAAVEARPSGSAPVSLAGLRVALKTDNGHYLTAEEGGGKAPFNRESVGGGWEVFTIEPQ